METLDFDQMYKDELMYMQLDYGEFRTSYQIMGLPYEQAETYQLYKCKLHSNNQLYTMKKILNVRKQEFQKELTIHYYLQSQGFPLVVKIIHWMQVKSKVQGNEKYNFYLITEDGQYNLNAYLTELFVRNQLTNQVQDRVVKQLLEIGLFLRQHMVVHLNIKGAQLLYFPQDDIIKITNFGSAIHIGQNFENIIEKSGLVGEFLKDRSLSQAFLMKEFMELITIPSKFWNENRMSKNSKKRFIELFGVYQDSYSIGKVIQQVLRYNQILIETSKFYPLVDPNFLQRKTIQQLLYDTYYVKHDFDAEFRFRIIVVFQPDFPDVKTKLMHKPILQEWNDKIVGGNIKVQPKESDSKFITDFSLDELQEFKEYGLTCSIEENLNRKSALYQMIRDFGIDYIEFDKVFYRFSAKMFMKLLVDNMVFQDVIYNVTLSKTLHEYFGLYYLLFADLFVNTTHDTKHYYLVQLKNFLDYGHQICVRNNKSWDQRKYCIVKEIDLTQPEEFLCIGHQYEQNEPLRLSTSKVSSVSILFVDPMKYGEFIQNYVVRSKLKDVVLKDFTQISPMYQKEMKETIEISNKTIQLDVRTV